MKTSNMWKKITLISLTLTLLIPVLAACTSGESNKEETRRALRFASSYGYIGDNGQAFSEYTDIYRFNNKNIDIEFVKTVDENSYLYPMATGEQDEERQDPVEKLMEVMQGPTPPDVVMIGYEHMSQLIDNGLLMPLDELIIRDQFDTDGIIPAVVDGLKSKGNGTLYALAPYINSSALIYNKKIFDDANVPYPEDKMTWQQAFDTARLVTHVDEENPIYGFSFQTWQGGGPMDLYWQINQYVAPIGLKWIDADTKQLTVDNSTWNETWKTFIDLYNEKVLPQPIDWSKPQPQDQGPYSYDMFLSGKTAMTIVNYSYLTQVIEANKAEEARDIEGFDAIDWDVVTVPVHPDAPNVGMNVGYQGIFAINMNAENPDDAWDFIKFVNGDDWARTKSLSSYNLVTRKDYIKPQEGANYNIDAFLQLYPAEYSDDENKMYQEFPNFYEVTSIGQNKFSEVVEGDKSVEQALQEWQVEGQAKMQELIERKANPDTDDGGVMIPFDSISQEKLNVMRAAGEIIFEDEAVFDEAETSDSSDSSSAASSSGDMDEVSSDMIDD